MKGYIVIVEGHSCNGDTGEATLIINGETLELKGSKNAVALAVAAIETLAEEVIPQ